MPKDKDKTYQAKLRYSAMSARKIRPYANLVRGRFADEALEILSCYPSRGARLIENVIKSALANAQDRDRHATNISDFEVIEIRVDGGPMASRFRPKSRGASSVYLKRSSHITVVVG
ncbi:MAG: 50S ribosomal protein L22 [Planctomycetaceae bacterium]|jgi:large subunit ribosomal protein L22|nr:50S ribosomal protein L22 [Planctomycetaceae bacterium]